MYTNFVLVAGLISLARAQSYTPPGAQTFGSLYTPDVSHPVTRGESFTVTWNPTGHTTDGSTVSLVLCRGGSGNCVNAPTAIVSGIPASAAAYNWAVPCSLATGVQSTATGYGMLIIVDGTGQFQYSTQFSVLEGTKCSSSSTNSSSSTTAQSSTSASSSSSSSSTTMSTSSTAGYITSSMKPNNYTMTTMKSSSHSTVPASTTVVAASTTPSASPSPSQFHGAANTIGGSAAALVMAAGAAFFAL